MSRLRAARARLGGPDAVTWPLFWVMFVFGALSQFAMPQPYVPLPLRIAAIIPAQVIMFLPLLPLRWFLQRNESTSHPWLVIGGYTVATALRAGVLTVILRAPDGSITVPFSTGFLGDIGFVLIMIVTTLVVSATRAHARDMQQLLDVRQQLAETSEAIERQITEQNEAALKRVQETLSRELVELERAMDDEGRLQVLHRLASDVVRPLSHELANFVPNWSPEILANVNARVDWRQVLTQFSRRGPFRPLVTAAVMVVMTFFTSLIYLGSRAVAFQIALLLGTVFGLWCANTVLDRLPPRRRLPNAVGLVFLSAILAAFVPAALAALIAGGVSGLLLGAFGCLILAGVAVLIGLVPCVLSAQRQTTVELAASNSQLHINVVRLRQAQWFHQRALARTLHGTMQSAVLAAAFRLEGAREHGKVTDGLRDEVRTDLARSIDVLGISAVPPMDLAAFTAQVTQVWSCVTQIEIEVMPEAIVALDSDPILRAMVMEITSESISNAVRHGRSEMIHVSMHCPNTDTLVLQVSSDRQSDQGLLRSGLGSRVLDDCTLGWQVSETEASRKLIARFPVPVEEGTSATLPVLEESEKGRKFSTTRGCR